MSEAEEEGEVGGGGVESMSDLQPGKQIVDVGERKIDTLGSGSGARIIGAVLRHRYFNADNTRVSELQAHDVRGGAARLRTPCS